VGVEEYRERWKKELQNPVGMEQIKFTTETQRGGAATVRGRYRRIGERGTRRL
jgi:hypothetical protein